LPQWPEAKAVAEAVCRRYDQESYGVQKRSGDSKMKTMDFKVVLEPDPDGGYVVTCPTLPGCYSQGESVDAALKNIREAIELCIEDMQERGEPLPDPSKTLVGSVLVTL
jgi:antitoxin HicB